MSTDSSEQFEFRLPDPGEGLTEAELIEWHVEEGEEVREDAPLCDVETDKAIVEISAPCTGIVFDLTVAPGDIAAVGEVIAVFETENPPRRKVFDDPTVTGDPSPDAPETSEGNPDASTPGEPSAEGPDTVASMPDQPPVEGGDSGVSVAAEDDTVDQTERIFAAPSTRRYAREKGVDLAKVDGSGPGGRILRADVDQHRETERDRRETTEATVAEPASPVSTSNTEIREPLRGLRRTIAENMQLSTREIPHVTSGFEANAGELVELKERMDEKHDANITYTAILVKAVVPALKEFPLVNASIDADAGEIVKHRRYNIGVATHTDEGLIVPVIEDVDQKSIVEVATVLDERVDAARNRTIEPADLRGGTFTITNTGSHGGHGTFGTPIIRHPEAAILGVGQIEEKPVAVDGELCVRDRIGFSFSFDHRLVDGVTAGQFVETIIEGIEDPHVLMGRL